MLAGAKSVLLSIGSIVMVLADVAAPENEYTPQPWAVIKTNNNEIEILIFKLVLFYFAV